jgi:hypothetical protein
MLLHHAPALANLDLAGCGGGGGRGSGGRLPVSFCRRRGLLARNAVPPPGVLPVELTGDVWGNSRVLAADGSVITTSTPTTACR